MDSDRRERNPIKILDGHLLINQLLGFFLPPPRINRYSHLLSSASLPPRFRLLGFFLPLPPPNRLRTHHQYQELISDPSAHHLQPRWFPVLLQRCYPTKPPLLLSKEHLAPGVEKPELLPDYCQAEKAVEATMPIEKPPCPGSGAHKVMDRRGKSKRITKKLFTAPHALRQEAETRLRVRHDKDPTCHEPRITPDLIGQDRAQIGRDVTDGHTFRGGEGNQLGQDRAQIGRDVTDGHTFRGCEGNQLESSPIRTEHIPHLHVEQSQPEDDHHETTTPRSGQSVVGSGEGPHTSSQAGVVKNKSKRNSRPKRDALRQAKRAKCTGVVLESQPRAAPPKRTRGPNQCHKYRPDKSKGEARFPLYWNANCRPTGKKSGKFGKYIGEEAVHPLRYPLHLKWGEIHEASLESFYRQALDDYEFLPQPTPEGSSAQIYLDEPNIYGYIKEKIQDAVRGRRHRIKKDCWNTWIITPEADRKALFQTDNFKIVDPSTWELLCEYFNDPDNQETAKINTENRGKSCVMYTGGSKNLAWATEEAEEEMISQGITPTPVGLYLATHSSSFDKDTGTYTYPNEATKEYCERVVKEAKTQGIGISPGNDPAELTKVLDSIHGGHHGGYERGLGVGPSRLALKRAKVPILLTQREKMEDEFLAQSEKMESELQTQREETKGLKAELRELKDLVNSGRGRPSADASSASGTSMSPDDVGEIVRTMMENGASPVAIGRLMAQIFKNSS